jgi:hypothetical protein
MAHRKSITWPGQVIPFGETVGLSRRDVGFLGFGRKPLSIANTAVTWMGKKSLDESSDLRSRSSAKTRGEAQKFNKSPSGLCDLCLRTLCPCMSSGSGLKSSKEKRQHLTLHEAGTQSERLSATKAHPTCDHRICLAPPSMTPPFFHNCGLFGPL